VIAGILLIAFLIHGQKFRFPTPTRWFLAFYGAMILCVPLAFWRANSVADCVSFLEIVAYILFATALLTTESRIRWFILTYVLLVDWLGGSALWNYAHGVFIVRMNIERAIGITSSAGDPNTMATTLLIAMPLSVALVVRSNPRWMRLIGVVSLAIAVVTIVDTGSRTSAFGILFLIALLLLRKPKNLIYLPILVLLGPLVWMMVPQQYKARYETVDHLKDDESYQLRISSWQGGVTMFESNPLTGIGPGNYAIANGEKFWPGNGRKYWLNAHSLYFQTIAEMGLLGVVVFGGYLICVFRLNFRVRKQLVEHNASNFLQTLPSLFNIMLCQLLFSGYAAHVLYRSTWYMVGAMSASLSLLPILQQTAAVPELAERGTIALPPTVQEWSPALLPVLRRQIPTPDPPA
jgi:O-antigen ligase